MNRTAAGTTMMSESPMTFENSAETMPEPKTMTSPPAPSTTLSVRSWSGVSELDPPCPAEAEVPPGTSCVTTPMVALAEALSRLKSFESRPTNCGFRSAARETARSISRGVARSTARIRSSVVRASGSSWVATMVAADEVDCTRSDSWDSSRSWMPSIRSSPFRESTFSPRWMSCVLPVSALNGVVSNWRWTSSKATCAGTSWVNPSVPASVETAPRPPANTSVRTRKTPTMRPGWLMIWSSAASTSRW